jgi:hypothetical protein
MPSTALACSCSSEQQAAWEAADYVIIGHVTEWETRDRIGSLIYTPVEFTLAVEGAFKGDVADEITFVDEYTYYESPGGDKNWIGSSGACGTFDADPTGVRGLYSVFEGDDGRLGVGMCSGSVTVEDMPSEEGSAS